MDFSDEYIDMCHNAVEVQKEWRSQEGDSYYIIEQDRIVRFDKNVYYLDQWRKNFNLVWLPRLDQIFEMIVPIYATHAECMAKLLDLAKQFYSPHERYNKLYFESKTPSLSEIALKYLMLIKHGKAWRENTWQPVTEDSIRDRYLPGSAKLWERPLGDKLTVSMEPPKRKITRYDPISWLRDHQKAKIDWRKEKPKK